MKYAINDTTTLQLVDNIWQVVYADDAEAATIIPDKSSFSFFEDEFDAMPLVDSESTADCYDLRTWIEEAYAAHWTDRDNGGVGAAS